MPIQPIDLQALFLHMNQPAKDQAVTRGAVVQAQALQAAKLAEQADKVQNDVNPTAENGDQDLRVEDKEGREKPRSEARKRRETEEEQGAQQPRFVDERLGKNVDVTG